MYITTFYSFIGGVGRTMALVNAAVSLAMKGRNVLVVDFDLEAPGLDTLDIFKSQNDVYGVNEFVNQYLKDGSAPDVSNFVAECSSVGDQGGQIWIMPSSGNGSDTINFNQINWRELYERYDGYLLFEDLKEQWNQVLSPDYVLINSRTGYTDASAICTRQLPDAVVVLFFPNEQNLRGLVDIVSDIRNESAGVRQKSIDLHFVMSNVPDLDDDDEILENKIAEFQRRLEFPNEPLIIHRYDSLSLLNQVVFTIDRPRSRLANEYKQIVREIIMKNWKDRDGVLEYIKSASRSWEIDFLSEEEKRLDKIEREHSSDGEVLFYLGQYKESRRDFESALELISRAIEEGYENPEAYLSRSRIYEINQETASARKDVTNVLRFERASPTVIREAIFRLLQIEEYDHSEIIRAPLIWSLSTDEKLWLAKDLNRTHNQLLVALPILKNLIESDDSRNDQLSYGKHCLCLVYIGLGKFIDALITLQAPKDDSSGMIIAYMFNYAMAQWGRDGSADRGWFQGVITRHYLEPPADVTPHYLQCLAVSHWAVGSNDEALEYSRAAEKLIFNLRLGSEFSYWRYLRVKRESFVEDLKEIRTLIENGEPLVPRFIAPRGIEADNLTT